MNLQVEDWRKGLEGNTDAEVIDVRTPAEWNEGVIPRAKMINIMDGPAFMEQIRSLDKNKEYYVYCRSGNRSFQACRYMEQEGLKAYNLEGGIMAWQGQLEEPVI